MSVNLFNISITLIYFFIQQDKENFTVTLTALLTGQSCTILCLKHEVIPMKCRLCNNTQRKQFCQLNLITINIGSGFGLCVIFSWVKRIDMLYWVLTISCNSTLPVSCVCWATLFGTQEHRCIGIQSCCFGGDLSNKKNWISWVKFFYLEDIYRFDAWCLNSKISAKAIGKTEC